MKGTSKLLMVAAVLAAFSAPVLAQSKECSDENKSAWYDTFLKARNGDGSQQKIAYDSAKQYLTSCPDDSSDIAQYLKKWVTAYEKGNRKLQFEDAFIKKDYSKTAELGKQLLADDPNNVRVYMLIGYGGYLASAANNATMTPEAVDYAKKAIEMIDSGKSPESWAPFTSRDQALAWLNYSIGKAKLANAPAEALPYLIKAARYDSELKKLTGTYTDILTAYEKGPRATLTGDYEAKYKGKPETPESKLAAANIDQIIDREIDAYARLAALTTNATDKKAVMGELTELYKYRNKSEAGLNELLASVLSKPLPDVPKPITSLPAPTPGSSPVNTGSPGTNGGSQPGSPGGTKPAGNTTSTTGQSTGAKPAASPTPASRPPKPRRAHNHA